MKTQIIFIILFVIFIICIKYNKHIRYTFRYYFTSIKNINKTKEPEYVEYINIGKKYIKNEKLIITGTIRDGYPYLEKTIKNLYKDIIPLFKDYVILIVENDSKDNTREVLLKYANKDLKFKVLGCGGYNMDKCIMKLESTDMNKCPRCSTRINKMVKIRNIYIDEIKKSIYNDYNIVLVIDMDLPGKIMGNGLFHTGYYFSIKPEIDAICALTLREMYYYHDPYAHIENGNVKVPTEIFHDVILKKCDKGGIDKVTGCFNGFTFYRRNSLIKNNYCTKVDKNNQAICEHDCLNQQLNNIYINYNMVYLINRNIIERIIHKLYH